MQVDPSPRDSRFEALSKTFCSMDDLEKENESCIDAFMLEYVAPFVETSDSHSSEVDKEFHFPMLYGYDYAFEDPKETFKYLDKLR